MLGEDDIFLKALDLPASERAAYLAQACGDDTALRQRVERLIAVSEGTAGIIDQSPVDRSAAEEQPGEVLDRYTLIRRIGEGGCGVVWLAEQTEPVRRTVALKIIKLGMNSAEVIRRFEAERQALAMMDHPDIARVFDAGTTDNGRPFFVMEFVDGVPITTYCDEHQLGVTDRLRLFTRVCEAIQHAHQKGIIHRDVKPSNVLVAPADGVPTLKVIDFGIAKATEQRLTDATLVTQLGQFLGTPAYMSPEQSQLVGGDIDTRTDVYSLGVLLYELLAGAPPFEPKALVAAGLEAMWQQIREVDPPRPSNRLQTLSPDLLRTTASRRLVDPPKLIHRIAGDLDWIVMRCLEKDRTRRYATATGLAKDIARHLANEPIEARPAGAGYRFAKLVRRNRLAFAAGTAVVLALVAGTVVSTWQAVRANRAERVARAVADFLQDDLLSQANSFTQAEAFTDAEPDPDLKVRTALERAAAAVGERFANDPLVEAEVRQVIGEAFKGIGLAESGVAQLQRAHALQIDLRGASAPQTLRVAFSLAVCLLDAGRMEDAADLAATVLAARRQRGDDENALIEAIGLLADLRNQQGRAEEAEQLMREALARRDAQTGEAPRRRIDTLKVLGNVLYSAGKYEEAATGMREVLAFRRETLGPDHPDTFIAINDLAATERALGHFEQSLALQREGYEIARRVLGPEHLYTQQTQINLAAGYGQAQQHDQAIALLEDLLVTLRTELGLAHQTTLTVMNNLAANYDSVGRNADSLTLREEMQQGMVDVFGAAHPYTYISLSGLGSSLVKQGRIDEGLPRVEEAWAGLQQTLGPEHPQTLAVMGLVARAYTSTGRLDEALALWRERLELQTKVQGAKHPLTIGNFETIGQTLEQLGRLEEAIASYRRFLALVEEVHGPDHAWANRAREWLAAHPDAGGVAAEEADAGEDPASL